MSDFQVPSKTDLLRKINAANGIALLATDFTFSNPKVVAGSWKSVNTDRNTAVQLTGNGTTYKGNVVVLYNRLDLGQVLNLPGLVLKANKPASTKDLFAQIRYYTGIPADINMLQDLPITLNSDFSGTAQLTAQPNSHGWQGSVAIPFTLGGAPIDQSITTSQLPGLNYPVSDAAGPPATATQGPLYLYAYDFTNYVNTLVNYTTGAITSDQANFLATAIAAVDVGQGKTLWNAVTTGATYTAWNLQGATILSNGLNNAALTPTNPAYKYVLALQLRGDVTVPAGTLYLHYNDPFNPDSF